MSEVATRLRLDLLGAAQKAREAAYAPYSKFKVGAAVRSGTGNIYTGCNVENASYGLSVCAERVAIFNAVASGDPEIIELAVFTDSDKPSPPCGACRQVLFEFGRTAKVTVGNSKGSVAVTDIGALFPEPFELPP